MNVTLFEDFIDATDKLDVLSGSSGSTTRVDGAGGIAEIATGSTSGNYRQLQTKSKNVEPKLTPVFSAYLRTKESDNLETFIGLADGEAGAASNLIGFYRKDNGTPGNWSVTRKSGGSGPSNQDLGVPGSTNFIELVMQASPTEVVIFLNGRLVYVETSTIPSGLMYFVLWIKTNTGAARTLVADYVQLSAAR